MNKSGNKSATARRRIARRRVWPLWIQPTAWSVLVAFVVGFVLLLVFGCFWLVFSQFWLAGF